MSAPERSHALARMVQWFEALTPATLEDIAQVYASDAHFQDPFNDVTGVAAIQAIYRHMFENLGNPRFEVTQTIEQGQEVFVAWRFRFDWRGQAFDIPGGTHMRFNAQGLIADHVDYWDVACGLYERLPLLGSLLRALRRRMSASGQK